MTDSSVPLGNSEEENGNELPDSTDSHVAGEAAVDCRPNQPCLDPGDHTRQGYGRVLVNHTCSGDPGECGGIPPPVQCQGLGDKRISDKFHKKNL